MDDSCAVCAENLEWVAYGPCGHRDVCSTCIVRLRFVLDDKRCCICKAESPAIFITKAMGDYTRVISDFAVFPTNATEGKVGEFWYHEDTQAYFDDADQYKMIKAMCRLSCSICDKNNEEHGSESSRRRAKFRSIEQLKGHLFHQHRSFMCSLCLEGRKVFICEQKLYSRSQLNQHISTGDSEVDGSESDRGGFMGHPMCEFCKNPFYGDNELYTHMSTEHYTCHICQRQHPGQYDYFRNYDDLETHFRQDHFLCENEACLAKKFVVFQSEPEMKRHNTIEHGGHMSRSKRNAALQIPTSFRFRQSSDQEQRRGRGRGFRREPSGNHLSMAIQASLETAISDGRGRESYSTARSGTEQRDMSENNGATGYSEPRNINSGDEALRSAAPVLEESSFPPLSDRDRPEPSTRYAQAIQSSRAAARLGEESFPPLPGMEKISKPKPTLVVGKNVTLAARLHLRNKVSVVRSSAWARPTENHESGSSSQQKSSTSSSSNSDPLPAKNPSAATKLKPTRSKQVVGDPARDLNFSNKLKHSSSAPNLGEATSSSPAVGNKVLPSPTRSRSPEDVHTANKSLVERIRAGVGMDEDRFATFKSISSEYREGRIETWDYLSCVEQFGLSHLVLELARLCPDPQKQKELIDAYNADLQSRSVKVNGKGKGKGKGKAVQHVETKSTRDELADSIMESVRKLQSMRLKTQEEEVEILSKDGYRKGKLSPESNTSSNQNLSKQQQRKTSKFLRVRLGDGSAAALLDVGRSNVSPERDETTESGGDPTKTRGVWRNGGGQRLLAKNHKNPSN